MTEAAKKRMEEKVSDYRITHDQNRNTEVFSPWSYKAGYRAGMSDPGANKELLDEAIVLLEGLIYPVAKTRDIGTYNKAIQDAVNRIKKLKEVRG